MFAAKILRATARLLCLGFVLVALGGCMPDIKLFMQTYEGPPLASTESALLKPTIGMHIWEIDGDKSKAITPIQPGKSNIDADISFRPGIHYLVVSYFLYHPRGTLQSDGAVRLTFDAQAGHKYLLIKEDLPADPDKLQAKNTFKWRPVFEDVTDKPERWCWAHPWCAEEAAKKSAAKAVQ